MYVVPKSFRSCVLTLNDSLGYKIGVVAGATTYAPLTQRKDAEICRIGAGSELRIFFGQLDFVFRFLVPE